MPTKTKKTKRDGFSQFDDGQYLTQVLMANFLCLEWGTTSYKHIKIVDEPNGDCFFEVEIDLNQEQLAWFSKFNRKKNLESLMKHKLGPIFHAGFDVPTRAEIDLKAKKIFIRARSSHLSTNP